MTLDPKETRPQTARNADLFKQLPLQVEMAQQKTQFYKELLKGVDPYSVT